MSTKNTNAEPVENPVVPAVVKPVENPVVPAVVKPNENAVTLTSAFLARAGIKLDFSAKSARLARQALSEAGAQGLAADTKADAAFIVAADALNNVTLSETAKRNAAIELAVLDQSKCWKSISAPNGKAYTSAHAFFKSLFPSIADSTISNYLGVARTVYIPALTKTYDETTSSALMGLSPTSALVLKGAVNDKATSTDVLAAVVEASKSGKPVTASKAREIVKSAKAKNGKAKENGTAGTPNADAKAQAATKEAELEAVLTALMNRNDEGRDGDVTIRISASDRKRLRDFFKEAGRNTNEALIAIRAIGSAINP